MAEAVAMRTSVLGGDREVYFISEDLQGGVLLGPKRVLPISLAAIEAPDLVHDALDRQLHTALLSGYDWRFCAPPFGAGNARVKKLRPGPLSAAHPCFQPLDSVFTCR